MHRQRESEAISETELKKRVTWTEHMSRSQERITRTNHMSGSHTVDHKVEDRNGGVAKLRITKVWESKRQRLKITEARIEHGLQLLVALDDADLVLVVQNLAGLDEVLLLQVHMLRRPELLGVLVRLLWRRFHGTLALVDRLQERFLLDLVQVERLIERLHEAVLLLTEAVLLLAVSLLAGQPTGEALVQRTIGGWFVAERVAMWEMAERVVGRWMMRGGWCSVKRWGGRPVQRGVHLLAVQRAVRRMPTVVVLGVERAAQAASFNTVGWDVLGFAMHVFGRLSEGVLLVVVLNVAQVGTFQVVV